MIWRVWSTQSQVARLGGCIYLVQTLHMSAWSVYRHKVHCERLVHCVAKKAWIIYQQKGPGDNSCYLCIRASVQGHPFTGGIIRGAPQSSKRYSTIETWHQMVWAISLQFIERGSYWGENYWDLHCGFSNIKERVLFWLKTITVPTKLCGWTGVY